MLFNNHENKLTLKSWAANWNYNKLAMFRIPNSTVWEVEQDKKKVKILIEM